MARVYEGVMPVSIEIWRRRRGYRRTLPYPQDYVLSARMQKLLIERVPSVHLLRLLYGRSLLGSSSTYLCRFSNNSSFTLAKSGGNAATLGSSHHNGIENERDSMTFDDPLATT